MKSSVLYQSFLCDFNFYFLLSRVYFTYLKLNIRACFSMLREAHEKNKKNLQKVLCLVNRGMFFCCGDFYEREEEKVQA